MGNSVLVFISHSSEDKDDYIEPIVQDLEDCYINVWIDTRKIVPGDSLRKSIFRDGLDKADVALIFFTEKSLESSWVDREIKHVMREEAKKGNDFDLKKIISVYDSKATYDKVSDRFPELTDDLFHLMPTDYGKKELGQLVSAIWSKYMDLQGGDVETQKQLLSKDKELFQKDKSIEDLKSKLLEAKAKNSSSIQEDEFEAYLKSGKVDGFLSLKDKFLMNQNPYYNNVANASDLVIFDLVKRVPVDKLEYTNKGKEFFKWYLLNKES